MKRRWAWLAALVCCLATVVVAGGIGVAQAPASGPAQIIKRAQKAREDRAIDKAVQTAKEATAGQGQQTAEAPAGDDQGTASDQTDQGDDQGGDQGAGGQDMTDEQLRQAHGGVSEATLRRIMGQGPPLSSASASADVPAGTIRVQVIDADGNPVKGAAVRLGIMAQGPGEGEKHSSQAKVTGDDGRAVFSGLVKGTEQAYRVSVPYEGAHYGATPFRLPFDKGYDVSVTRLEVTHNPRVLLQFMGQTIIELSNDRLHITQHAQLTDMSDRTYVFPPDGFKVRLPAGFEAFQGQKVMTDQKFEATDAGFKLHGSVEPGPVTLAWTYDLPIHGSGIDFGFPVPFRTYLYRVLVQDAPGLQLHVSDMPPPVKRETDQGPFLVTQVRRNPRQPPLDYVTIRMSGIPGPGPWRWFAVGGALAFLLAGVFLAIRGGREAESALQAREERKKRLLAEAVDLERLFARHEVGPQYHKRRMNELLGEIASLLKQDDRSRRSQPGARKAR